MTSQPPTPDNSTPDNQDPQSEPPAFGWKPYAERINSRFAMIGFAALLILEFSTGQDFFSWLGLR